MGQHLDGPTATLQVEVLHPAAPAKALATIIHAALAYPREWMTEWAST
jgi:hypothetical protein